MPRTSKAKIKKIKEIEFAINKNLFHICAFITLIAMVMMIVGFFTRGSFPSPQVSVFYIGILFIYSIHKEMLRWLEEKEMERQGEWFVYSWIGLALILYIMNFITKDYFSHSSEGTPVDSLKEISNTTLEVCAIFILTRLSKILKIILERR